MTGNKMLQLVMPNNYRQGYTYKVKESKMNILTGKSKPGRIAKSIKRMRKNGQTMLRRALKRDMLNQLKDDMS